MSSQAERIKAFKLAQHARLQKQDEEEQWISSEELCTEGSSDEEATGSSKISQRKQKRNVRPEKRGISPLAQPPRTEPEFTSRGHSKYLNPDDVQMYSEKPEKTEETVQNRPTTSKMGSSSLESETDEDKEIEKMIQWRPKRGSIKLPDFPEGMQVEVSTDRAN